jgi:hypothetical protein
VSTHSAESVVHAIEDAGLWSAPTLRLADSAGNDGGRLLLEGRKGARYQIVYHWQPHDEPLGNAARALIGLAGATVPEGLLPSR